MGKSTRIQQGQRERSASFIHGCEPAIDLRYVYMRSGRGIQSLCCTLARDMTVAKGNDLSVCRASHASRVEKSRSEKLRGSKSITTVSNIDQHTPAAKDTAPISYVSS